MYQKPVLQKFGSFRDLTLLGVNGSTDGAVVLGITSTGCTETADKWTWNLGCDTGPRSS
jgi:hypothetical protein